MPHEIATHPPDHAGSDAEATGAAPSALAVLLMGAGDAVSHATRHLLDHERGLRGIDHARESTREGRDGSKHPDVVVLEVDARREDAADTVRAAATRWSPAPVLVVTESEDRALNRRLVRSGARGVVTHSRRGEQLVNAVHRVHDGEIWLARGCMSQLIDEMVAANHPMPDHLATPEGLDRLTEREREVVALIAQGMHNKAIAAELGITDHTVRHHLTAIFAKLGVADRLELAVYAFRHHPKGGRAT